VLTRRVTVCELPDDRRAFDDVWPSLRTHIGENGAHLLVLPEMPFSPWLAVSREFDAHAWADAVRAHDTWLDRLAELAPAASIGSRPVIRNGRRLNEGFVCTPGAGVKPVHHKRYLPDEEGYWEARWYEAGGGPFVPFGAAGLRIGMTICTDQWALGHAMDYGRAGVHLIATPRATGRPTVDKWIAGARAAAVVSGAFAVSSNWAAAANSGGDFGGCGWIIDPDGAVLARTDATRPFVTLEIDFALAEAAKHTYPRYALRSAPDNSLPGSEISRD
jgi:N-carbamoylputrescine amidase